MRWTAILLASACYYSSNSRPSQPIAQPPPGQPTAADPSDTQPAPYEHAPTLLSATGSPTTTNTTPEQPPVAVTAWSLFKTKDGCATAAKVECAATTPCTPPPAQTYACLGGVKLPATIVSNGDSCSLDCTTAPCRAVPCPAL